MKICPLSARALAAALFLCGLAVPGAQAQTGSAPAALPGVAPFTQRAEDQEVLQWAKRWADENLDDPAERAAMLAYAISAAERREVLARPVRGADNAYSAGGTYSTAFTHLRRVTFLVELRRAALAGGSAAGSDDWNARHLCNGSLVAPQWVLTAATCVPASAAAQPIEARIGVQDLSQSGGQTLDVIRIERNAPAGLALLELDHPASSAGTANAAPVTALTGIAASQYMVEFLGLGFGRTQRPGWPGVLYRHFALALPEPGSAGAIAGGPPEPGLTGSGLRLCPGDNGSPIYVYDLEAGPLLAGVVTMPPGAQRGCFETIATGPGNPDRPAPVTPILKWAPWIAAVTGVTLPAVEPRQLPGTATYSF